MPRIPERCCTYLPHHHYIPYLLDTRIKDGITGLIHGPHQSCDTRLGAIPPKAFREFPRFFVFRHLRAIHTSLYSSPLLTYLYFLALVHVITMFTLARSCGFRTVMSPDLL